MFSSTTCYWFYLNPSFDILVKTDGKLENQTLHIMMGYIIYDTIYELTSSSKQIDILIHHIIGFLSHLSTIYTQNNSALYYSMFIFLAEASTPFLNISWILYQLKYNNNLLFHICSILLLITFFIFRVILGPYAVYHLFINKYTWGIYDNSINYYMWSCNTFIIILFALLNIFWFYKLIKMATGGTKKGGSKKRA